MRFPSSAASIGAAHDWHGVNQVVSISSELQIALMVPRRGPVERTSDTVLAVQKVGRNKPCPCGSGTNYKLMSRGPAEPTSGAAGRHRRSSAALASVPDDSSAPKAITPYGQCRGYPLWRAATCGSGSFPGGSSVVQQRLGTGTI